MEYLLKASVVITVFFICYSVFLKRETFFQNNRWFLLIGLLLAILLPFVVIPVEIPVEPTVIDYGLYPIENLQSIEKISPSETPFNWMLLLSIIYFIGLLIFLIQFVLQFGSLTLILLKSPKLKDGFYTYVIVKNRISPFSFFKWIVYNPKLMEDKEVELMLTHEKVHVDQMHSIDILLVQLACSIFWFNPFIWLYRKDLRQNLEYIADYSTQSISGDTSTYQKLLVKTCVANSTLSLTNNFYNSSIKKRIVMLQKSKSKSRKQWRYILILPLLAGILMSMNTKEVYIEVPSAKEINSKGISNPELEIIFTKNTSDEDFKKIKEDLKSNGVTMTTKELKRNAKGEIVKINLDFKTKNGSSNYAVSNEKGIGDFYFRMSKDGSFGVGSVQKREVVIVEGIPTGKPSNNQKNKVIIHKDDEVHEVIIDESKDINVDVIKGNRFVYTTSDDKNEFIIKMDSTDTNVWTDSKNYTYVIGSSPDSIEVKTITIKGDSLITPGMKKSITYEIKEDINDIKTTSNKLKYKITGNDKVGYYDFEFIDGKSDKTSLIIIDDEVQDMSTFKNLDSKNIKSVTVLKDDSALKLYGEKGKNGVIVVKTKKSGNNKWVVSRAEVNSIAYYDDDDKSKNATKAYITKYTPDSVLEKNKQLLKEAGITVKYSKIRRNKAGEITSIKIKVRNNSGSESSASWRDDDGIPGIEYGISEGSLIARTSTMNK